MPNKPLAKPQAKPSSVPPLPKAARVFKGDAEVGALGAAPGPFISARRDAGRSVSAGLAHVRYTSQAYPSEQEIRPLLDGSYAEVVERLEASGFRVEAAPYAELFEIMEDADDPSALKRLQRDLDGL